MSYNRQQILESIKKIPNDIRDIVASVEKADKLVILIKKHNLQADKLGELGKQTDYVLLGLEHPSKFIGNLARTLGMPEEKARMIAEDINVEIFRPVRESLKKIHGIVGEENLEKVTPPPAPVVPKLPVPPVPQKPETNEPKSFPKSDLVSPQIGLEENKIPNEDETKLNREEILAGIENPAPTKPTPQLRSGQANNIVQDKLDGMVRMPKSEQEVKELSPAPSKSNYQTDPYREPLK